jgi:uncharacterized protein YcfL
MKKLILIFIMLFSVLCIVGCRSISKPGIIIDEENVINNQENVENKIIGLEDTTNNSTNIREHCAELMAYAMK